MAAEHLLRHHGVVEALVGKHTLDHRRHQAGVVIGRLAILVVAGAMRDVRLDGRPQRQRTACLVERLHGHQRAADIGMNDDRIGLLVRRLGAGKRPALEAVLGVEDGVLISDLGDRKPLQADAEAGLVHHREHGLQAAVQLAEQGAFGLVIVHDAG